MSKDQFKADVDILTTADSGWRDPFKCLWGVFHTTEDPEGKDPEATARWQLDPANDSSYNMLVGADGKTVRSNDDDYSPWSVGMPGNRLGIHAAAVGKAARNRAAWMQRPAQLESLAQWAADLNRRYGIPLRWLSVDEVRRYEKGFTSHANYYQAIAKAQGMDYRSDPGDGFPHEYILGRAHRINAEGMVSPGEVKTLSSDNRLDLALDQLVGFPWRDYPGWPQLGGRSIVDALADIGEHLGIDGFKGVN